MRRATTTARRRGLPSCAVVLSLLCACQPDYEPNWIYRGKWIDVDGRDREAEDTCAGTFDYLDRYAGALAVEFGVDERLAPYRWYSPEQYAIDKPCGEDPEPVACAWPDGIDTPRIPDEHEVVHLVNSIPGQCPNIIAEGLAGYYATTGWTPGSDGLERLAEELEAPSARIRPGTYGISGRFAAFLVEQYGLAAVLQLCSISGRHPDDIEFAGAIESVFGITTDEMLAAFTKEYTEQPSRCNTFEGYQSRVYACGAAGAARNAGAVGIPGEALAVTYDLGCTSESTVGPHDGYIWITERIDFLANASYDVALRDEAGDIPDVELIIAQCGPCGRVHDFPPGEFLGPEQFEVGRYWLELRAPVDFHRTLSLTIKLSN